MANFLRQSHNQIALLALVLLGITSFSGFVYRFLRNVIGLEKTTIGWMLEKVHQGNWFNSPAASLLYVTLNALVLSFVLFSGFSMLKFKNVKGLKEYRSPRQYHSSLAPIGFVLLAITVATGFLYSVLKYYGVPKENIKFLMGIHQGSILGSSVLYTFLLFVVSGALIVTGWNTKQKRRIITNVNTM